MAIRVVEVRPGRWSYMIDGVFPVDSTTLPGV